MKPIIFTLIILFFTSCKEEPDKEELHKLWLIRENKACDSLKTVAKTDFAARKKQYTRYGTVYSNRLNNYCDNEIEQRYGIKIYNSCTDEDACYKDEMNSLICKNKKWAYNFIDSIEKVIIEEYKTKFPEEYAKYLKELEEEDL